MTPLELFWSGLAAYGLLELLTRGAILRRAWREFSRFFILLELAAVWVMRQAIPPRYVLLGACQRRGDCCRQILGDPPGWLKRSFLLHVWIAFHRVAHNFVPVARGPNDEVIFSCNHLQTDGRCGIYAFRPLLCRNYPVVGFYDVPHLLPGCGFSIAPRVVTQMQKRKGLSIVNPVVSVHHPSPESGSREPQPEHYQLVDTSPAPQGPQEQGEQQ